MNIWGHTSPERGASDLPRRTVKKNTRQERKAVEMENLAGIEALRNRLNQRKIRVDTRYRYYEMKNKIKELDISTPPKLKGVQTVLGWCGKAVDSMADRLMFREFAEDNFSINEIFQMNNPDTFFDSAILSALIGSCSFVYISKDDSGYPRLQMVDGRNATGVMDPVTGLLTEGYAVLERDSADQPKVEAYFTRGNTRIVEGRSYWDIPNEVPYPLLVPIVNRPDVKRPFGHSRISRATMDIVNSAMRTVKRAEISAEFYSFPQKYVVGTSQDAEPLDKWKSAMSYMIEITKDEDGDKPTFGQFQQQSMTPHTEQLRMFAGLFAGETGLTLDDLGFPTENPSSAEAIKASHENLRLIARKSQRTFGTGFLNVGYLAACLRDDFPYERRQFYLTKPKWEPVFEPDAAALSSYGDGAIKINQAIPGYIDSDRMRDLAGF